jgi:hypothetical protein
MWSICSLGDRAGEVAHAASGVSPVTRPAGPGPMLRSPISTVVSGPGALQDLQGPSYVYAILTDPRVRESQVT